MSATRTIDYNDVRQRILLGNTPKEIAYELQQSIACIGKVLGILGLRKHYLTKGELATVMAARSRAGLKSAWQVYVEGKK